MNDNCDARHPDASRDRHCLGLAEHKGDHWAFGRIGPGYKFWWPNEAEAEKPNVFLTPADLSILLTALNPIKQFFPELESKLTDAKKEQA